MGRRRTTRPKGSIREREGGWEARLPYSVDKKRSALSGRYRTAEEAQDALDEAIRAVKHRQQVATVKATRGMTVTEVCEKYVAARASDPDSPLAVNTVVGYKAAVKNLVKPTVFGGLSVMRVKASDVNRWQQHLVRENVPQSRRDYARRVVSASFSWAYGLDLMPEVSLLGVRKRGTKLSRHTQNQSGVILPTWQQFATLVAHPDRWEDRVLLALLGWCGLRWGEARSLTVESVNTDDRTLWVDGVWVKKPATLTGTGATEWVREPVKAGNPASVPVPKDLFACIERLCEERGTGLLFRADQRKSRGGEQVLSSSNFRSRVMVPAVMATGAVPAFRVKDLRAFAGSTLVDSGATVVEVAGLLRHDVRTSEKFYLRPSPSDPDRYKFRNTATGATLAERIDSLYSVWLGRFPHTGLRLTNTL